MKIAAYIFFGVFISGIFLSCKKDNYSSPQSQLTGTLMYNSDTVHVEYNRVPFQLYQYGFGKVGPIEGTFSQDGVLDALLFNGDYKLIIPNGQGPFLWKQTALGAPDSLAITMGGNQNINIEVTPYYMIRNAQISGSGSSVSATFQVEKIITDANAKDIESVSLFISKTKFVSGTDNIARTDLAGSDITDPNDISLTVSVPSISPAQNYVFARIGLKIASVEDMIFSPLVTITY